MVNRRYRVGALGALLAVGLCTGTMTEGTFAAELSESYTEQVTEQRQELSTEAPAETVTEVPTEPQTEPPTEPVTEPQTTPPSETSGSEGQSESDGAGESETSGETITEGDTIVDGSESETEASGNTEGTTGDGGTEGSTANQEAFDQLILEDENGVMEQVIPEETRTEGETEKPEEDEIEITEGKVTVTRWGESLMDFQAYPVGDLSQNQAAVYRFLRDELGLNKAAACGVLANIQCESGFSPVAVGDGGSSYGLCQWHAGRFYSLVNWCNGQGLNYHLIDGQLQYLKAELESGYTGVLEYLRNVPDTARGAYEAGYYWCMYFEIPDNTVNRSIYRGKIAMNNYYPVDLDEMEKEAAERKSLDGRTVEILDGLLLIEDPDVRFLSVTEFCLHSKVNE